MPNPWPTVVAYYVSGGTLNITRSPYTMNGCMNRQSTEVFACSLNSLCPVGTSEGYDVCGKA